jgi:glycerophosphoryl diester phosphodiesterase
MTRILSIILVLMFFQSLSNAESPIVIAHRGASGYVPEHTLEAKSLAHAMQADFIEQDIVLTKDAVPVVLHDVHIDTVSNVVSKFPRRSREDGRYYAIDFTLDELKQLQLTERLDQKTGKQVYPNRFSRNRGSFQIATLSEELELIQELNRTRGFQAGIYPEIKQPAWHRKEGYDVSQIVLPILRKFGYLSKKDPCWLQCFEFDEVRRLREELDWQGKLVWLVGSYPKGDRPHKEPDLQTDAGMEEISKLVDGIGPSISLIVTGKSPTDRQCSTLASRAHDRGLQVHPYTMRVDDLPVSVSSPDDLMEVLFNQAKVDGLFSDFPDVTRKWVDAHRQSR